MVAGIFATDLSERATASSSATHLVRSRFDVPAPSIPGHSQNALENTMAHIEGPVTTVGKACELIERLRFEGRLKPR
jgi:hypothetical protein